MDYSPQFVSWKCGLITGTCRLLHTVAGGYVQGGPKNVSLYFCRYLRQLLIDFENSFTCTPCRQFAITWLLHIPPHRKCVSTLPCEISMKYAYITTITNKHFGKIGKKHRRLTLQWMLCMTLNCVGITQSSVIQIIHCNVGLKCFFIYLIFYYYR